MNFKLKGTYYICKNFDQIFLAIKKATTFYGRGARTYLNMMRTDIFEMDSVAPSVDDYFL